MRGLEVRETKIVLYVVKIKPTGRFAKTVAKAPAHRCPRLFGGDLYRTF